MNLAWKTIGGLAVGLLLIGQGCPASQPSQKDAEIKSKPAVVVEEKKEGEVMDKSAEGGSASGGKEGEVMEKKEGEATEKKEEAMMEKKTDAMMSADLKLSAEAQGEGLVKLTWTAPAGLNEANRFIIVRDELENPEHSGNNFWIRQSHLKRETVWEMVPTGTMHFRLCLTENDEKDVCTKYSNDVVVEVK